MFPGSPRGVGAGQGAFPSDGGSVHGRWTRTVPASWPGAGELGTLRAAQLTEAEPQPHLKNKGKKKVELTLMFRLSQYI